MSDYGIKSISIDGYRKFPVHQDTEAAASIRDAFSEQMECFLLKQDDSENVNVLGVVIRDRTDNDYAYVVSRRVIGGGFRCVRVDSDYEDIPSARVNLIDEMKDEFKNPSICESGEIWA